jgi:hypothetical protein
MRMYRAKDPKKRGVWFLRLQKACGEAIVAIKLNVVKGGGDTVPAGHGGGFHAAHMGHSNHDDVAQAQGFADQDDFELDGSISRKRFGAEKEDASGTDVPGDERDGSIFARAIDGTEAQGKIEDSAGVFAMFGMHPYGVSGNANEAPGLRGDQKRL